MLNFYVSFLSFKPHYPFISLQPRMGAQIVPKVLPQSVKDKLSRSIQEKSDFINVINNEEKVRLI